MCGIAGVYNYRDWKPVESTLCNDMIGALAHRGPDDDGLYFCDRAGLALGHRRLSIIDLAAGHQPMSNEDATVWVVFNGEIYNFQDLRPELESCGHTFQTRSDTETIVHAYEQWGIASFPRLNGMFAFALWDEKKRTLVLARDPFGIKPLYYWNNGKTLAFASEIKSILHHPDVERAVDPQALSDYLSLTYVPSPRTVFAGINKLPPGYALVCTPEGVVVRRFYRNPPRLQSRRSEQDVLEELRSRLVSAVKRQMIADVPIGAMLSGGVDSSMLASIMTELAGGPIETFTIGFEGDFKLNELEAARASACRIGSHHREIVVSADEYVKLLPHTIWHLEEPVATDSTLAFYMVCQLAREHVKVVLTGQGADEPFAGYPRHLGERYGSLYRRMPTAVQRGFIKPLIQCLPRNEPLKRAVSSLGAVDPLDRFIRVYNTMDPSLKQELLRGDILQGCDASMREIVQSWQSDVAHLDGLSQMLYVDARLSLADKLLMYGDKMSMAVSLEARVPYLDLELMEFVESLPPALKIRGRTQKYLLKKAAAKWVPRDVIYRKKIGFQTPLDEWLQKELRCVVEDRLLSPGSACRTYLEPEVVRQMLDDHQRRRQNHRRTLLSLLTFEIWHEQFIKPFCWPSATQRKAEVALQ
jgi:asparagine synthase (glutamine-hydrolysing)